VKNPKWTVGVTVEIKLYKFMEGTPRQRNCFVEMWDIGGSSNHKNTRDIFYSTIHGMILIIYFFRLLFVKLHLYYFNRYNSGV